MTKKEIKLQNIVATCSLGKDVPLIKLAETLPNTEYNPEQFPGLVMRIKEPKTSALIFSSGNIVCTGAKSMKKVKESIQVIIKNVAKVGVKVTTKPQIKVQNMVASGDIGIALNLNQLAMQLENTEYEPEQFPGAIMRLKDIGTTLLLFKNGKVICSGAKSEKQIAKSIKTAVLMLRKFIK